MSLDKLSDAITDKTIAIIAVRFFGIDEQFKDILEITKKNNILLIEDSAQGFPVNKTEEDDSYWHGDLIVLSFGRGKPVNLLGGGAVLTSNSKLLKLLPEPTAVEDTLIDKIKYKLRVILYNLTIQPFAYGLLTRIPGLKIGQTIYKPLINIKGMHSTTKSLLSSNIEAYQTRKNCQAKYRHIFKDYDDNLLLDIPKVLEHDMTQPLLRYPVLIRDTIKRDAIYKKLKSYGASLMYQKPLHLIDGIGDLIKPPNNDYPNANLFAKQLLTLPTHEGVDKNTLDIITNAINEIVS